MIDTTPAIPGASGASARSGRRARCFRRPSKTVLVSSQLRSVLIRADMCPMEQVMSEQLAVQAAKETHVQPQGGRERFYSVLDKIRIDRTAGRSAREKYRQEHRIWLRETFTPGWILLFAGLFLGPLSVGIWTQGTARFIWAMCAGGTVVFFLTIIQLPPPHIGNWLAGSDGERWTAKMLQPLTRRDWSVVHDLGAQWQQANIDHVVVGRNRVFLLDTKAYSGSGNVRLGRLIRRHNEDPGREYASEKERKSVCRQSAALHERIKLATGQSVWVEPVIVLWMRLDNPIVESRGVTFVHGSRIAT